MRPKIGVIGAGVMGAAHGKTIHFCLKSGLIDGEFVAHRRDGRRAPCAVRAGVRRAHRHRRRARADRLARDQHRLHLHADVHTTSSWRRARSRCGKAVFCEKPLAFNAHDAAIIRDAAKAAGVTHQVGLVMRFSPVISVVARPHPRSGVRPRDDVRDDRRPVLSDPGPLREHLARRCALRRCGHAARARDPRRRHPAVVLRARAARVRRHAPLRRARGHRGPEQRHHRVRGRRGR